MLKAIIIEDEPRAATALRGMLRDINISVHTMGTADRLDNALQLIDEKQPDLVFLDVQLIDCTGFDVLNACQHRKMEVIFTTAFDDLAIKAFKENAIGYLLKPIDPEALERAVIRASALISSYSNAGDNVNIPPIGTSRRLRLHERDGNTFTPISSIVYAEAKGAYSHLYLKDGSVKLVSRHLGSLEEELSGWGFIRCHRSFLVNAEHIISMSRGRAPTLKLSNDARVAVASSKRADILQRLHHSR